ncbi:MAG: GNAT family N-acetyltransferase [Syntrophobacteraceae bacterium]|nr:GNAT family N-acetyltransferase [Syntrophobacteraceae bacterium]
MGRPLNAKIYSTIEDVPRKQWAGLASNFSRTQDYEFWRTIERSNLNDFDYRYAVFTDEAGEPAILLSFYTVTTDMAIFAPAGLRNILAGIRRISPNFLKIRTLECGTPVTLTSPPYIIREDISTEEAITAVNNLLMGICRDEGHFILVIRDLEQNAADHCPIYRHFGYHLVDSLPNTHMEIRWNTFDEYLASMKSYYRCKTVKYLRRNEKELVSYKVVDDFHDMAEILHAQWQKVYDHAAEFQREILTPSFYREFSERLGKSSKVILFYRREKLVGHALLMVDGSMLRWLYFGREEAGNDDLYLYVAQKVVETAINLKAGQLEMGLTTYPIKQDLGARITPIKFALRARSKMINPFVGFFYALMNDSPGLKDKEVFKKSPNLAAPCRPAKRVTGAIV